MTPGNFPIRALTLVGVLACAACGPLEIDDDRYAISGENKIALNKIALNKIALNKIALNTLGVNKIALNELGVNKIALNKIALNETAVNKIALNKIALNELGGSWVTQIDARVWRDGGMEEQEFPGDDVASLDDVDDDDLLNIFEKSVRCINEPGDSAILKVKGAYRRTAYGMFGLGKMDLTYPEFLGAYMSCMAVWANDDAALINVTADLPNGDGIVVDKEREFDEGFVVPGISVAYKVEVIDVGDEDSFQIDGHWLWNASRHQSWMDDPRPFGRAMSWFHAYGRNLDSHRACLEALMARTAMPAECGGDASEVWNGRLLADHSTGTGDPSDRILCGGDLWSDQGYRGVWALDHFKGVDCGETGPSTSGELPAVFYADLPSGVDFEDVLWWTHQMNFIGSKGGGGSGSGSP